MDGVCESSPSHDAETKRSMDFAVAEYSTYVRSLCTVDTVRTEVLYTVHTSVTKTVTHNIQDPFLLEQRTTEWGMGCC